MMQKEEYDQAGTEVADLTQMNEQLQNETAEERRTEAALEEDQKKTHSILFHFEGGQKRESELQKESVDRSTFNKDEADITQTDSKIAELIQKKSILDRMVPYDGKYLALTGLGVVTLNDLNIRNYRVSDREFSDFAEESRDTWAELRSIAESGNAYVSNIRTEFPKADLSQLWDVSIGLAKLQGDRNQIGVRFLLALGLLQHFKSTIENKMMAAEIMTSFRTNPSQMAAAATSTTTSGQQEDDSDLQKLAETLVGLDKQIRHDENVPKQLSAGVAAIIMAGRKFDGTYPTDRFEEFSKMTKSSEAAAILSVINVPPDLLTSKFQSFRALFNSWGYQASEDTELASAYLAAYLTIANLGPDDVKTKLSIIIDGLKTYLEYPLVAAAVLTSIPTLEANETIDLMEKAYNVIASYATGLERSELICLSVRMIHGIRNELVKDLDPTAKLADTPIQFTHPPSYMFFGYHAPLILAHSTYFATFSGIGGLHPAHVHGFGAGFAG